MLLPLIIIIMQIHPLEHIRWKILEACVNTCWQNYVESVSKIKLVLSITFFIFIATYVCIRLTHSSLGDWYI